MTIASTTPVLPAVKPTRYRWLRWVLALLTLAILGFFATKFYLDWQLRFAWENAEAEADRLDPGWRLKEMIAAFDEIPDHENSALLIREILKEGGNDRIDADKKHKLLFKMYPPTARLNDEQVELLRPQWAERRASIETARKLKDMPRGRLPMTNPDDWDALAARDTRSCLLIADWLKHDALLAAQDGKYQMAAESCLAIVNAGRSIRDEQGLIVVLHRFYVHQFAIESLERVLAQGKVSDETLRKIQAALDEDARDSIYLRGVRGARVWERLLLENIRDGKKSPDVLAGGGVGPRAWIQDKFPSSFIRSYPERLHQMNQHVEIAKLPIHERTPKLAEHFAAVEKSGNPLTVGLINVREIDIENQGMLRSAIAALACERYRLTYRRYPATLDDLIKEKLLSAVPADPVDGAPLRMRATGDGIVVYSIGKNGIDEQGNRRHGVLGAGDDEAFRLWNEEFRGRLPMVPLEGKKK